MAWAWGSPSLDRLSNYSAEFLMPATHRAEGGSSTSRFLLQRVRPMNAQCPNIVFVIDDDVSVRKALGRLLRAAGPAFARFASASAFGPRPLFVSPSGGIPDVRL